MNKSRTNRIYEGIKTSVKKVLYYNQTSNWGVLSVKNTLIEDPFFKDETLILTGNFKGIYEGCEIKYSGNFAVHQRYGNQITLTAIEVCKDLKSKEAIINFLVKSGIKGISYQNARKIYDKFGSDSIDVVLKTPEKIKSIVGIGEGTYKAVLESIEQYKRMEKLISYCTDLGVPFNVIYRLDKDLGDDALKILKDNIFEALKHSEMLTFNQLDEIALKSGMEADDIRRLRACLIACLKNRIMMSSSTGCSTNELRAEFLKKLGLDNINLYTATLNQLKKDNLVCIEGSYVYFKPFYDKEEFIAKTIANIHQTNLVKIPSQKTIEKAIKQFPFTLNEQQINAINGIMNNRVTVLTGGPGTGKSTITKALTDVFREEGMPFVLLSPTGKATRRMEECTGCKAQTIHKFLHVKKSLEDATPPEVPVNTALIIDESSMMDIMMLAKLLEIAVSTPIRIIFVGDKDQLPSVQAGNVLSDLIASKVVPTFILTDIMRQAQDSHIIKYCTDINHGNIIEPCEHDDFIFREYEDEVEIINDLQDIFMKELKRYDLSNVQIITPYKKGELGVITLNKEISNYYNKNPLNETMRYKVGDKVMQIANDYNKGVFNGESGVVTTVNDAVLRVRFNSSDLDEEVEYTQEDLDTIMTAYACTCHKSQGAEYSAVIVVLDDSVSSFLLNRKLLYTAVSRGKKNVYILSKPGCLKSCIENTYECPRITKLAAFLKSELPSSDEILELID